jgi:uncharacterized membrane protein YkvI
MEKKFTFSEFFLLTGALLAYLIGSGFSSGQETVQYYSGYGYGGILVGLITFCIMYLSFIAYSYAGRMHGLQDLAEIYNFYAGKYPGKLFEVFAWLFVACCYVFMVSGFGSTLHQQWGIPVSVGSGIAVLLSVATAIFGLRGIVNVIGKIGPVIVLFTLVIGIISSFTFFPKISTGIEFIKSGAVHVTTAATNWFTAGLSFGGCSILLVSAFVAKLGSEYRNYDYKQFKLVLLIASLTIPGCSTLMGMNHLGNIVRSSQASIPNLALANRIFGAMGTLFAIIILLAIYSTICPLMWTAITQFVKDEQSLKYKAGCVGMGLFVWFIACNVPYETLLNYIMTYCGYSGGLIFAVCVIRYFMVKNADKKGHVEIESNVAEESCN